MTQALLVTGAAGQPGHCGVDYLLERNARPSIAPTCDPFKLAEMASKGVDVRIAEFDKPTTLFSAFAGADRLLLIGTNAVYATGQPIAQHRPAMVTTKAPPCVAPGQHDARPLYERR